MHQAKRKKSYFMPGFLSLMLQINPDEGFERISDFMLSVSVCVDTASEL